jgi:hypothetical protein
MNLGVPYQQMVHVADGSVTTEMRRPRYVRLPPDSDQSGDIGGGLRWVMCGRLRVGKKNLHVAALVGAAMCSAFDCGTQDRWP